MPSDAPQSPKFYVTTPIYYVNARPHIGHAYTTIVADVLARRHRLLGDDTFFLTGTDEHGQKIERSAAAAGIPPQQFTDEVSAQFRSLWDRMGLTYNRYIRTTDPAHKLGAQKLFRELYKRGFIYLSTYTGSYCVSDEAFVDQPAGTPCPDCGRTLETVTEENFFFKLSAFQDQLIQLIESNELLITPDTARNEVLSFIRGDVFGTMLRFVLRPDELRAITSFTEDEYKEALRVGLVRQTARGTFYVPGTLKDLSVSRSSFTWGIPVPADVQEASGTTQNHVIYVWLDALTNYMTAVGYGSDAPEAQAEFARYWPADLHLVGKEITRFHCVYWPAFLLAAGLRTPKQITANGWLLFDNAKMSKSRGNVVRTETILDAFGDHVYGKQFPEATKQERDLFAADVLRYFLLREIPFGQDGSFSFDALCERYNADLTNGYGNLVSRVLSMIEQFCGTIIPHHSWGQHYVAESHLSDIGSSAFIRAEDNVLTSSAALVVELRAATSFYSRAFPELQFSRQARMQQSGTGELLPYTVGPGVLDSIQFLVGEADVYITKERPWKLGKSDDPDACGALNKILYASAEAIRIITALLYPILPHATAKVWQQLGLGDIEAAARNGELNNLEWGGLQPGTKLGPLAPIFPRADKALAQVMIDMEDSRNTAPQSSNAGNLAAQQNTEQDAATPPASLKASTTPTPAAPVTGSTSDPAAAPRTSSLDEPSGTLPVGGSTAQQPTLPTTPGPHTDAPASGVFSNAASATTAPAATAEESAPITIDDFLKVELRVAQVLVAERIPKADKLLRLEVDLGTEKRQILSGIAQWYTPEELIGRRIVVVSNLAPRKMRGLESHGMLLAASEGADGKPVLATFGEDIALGSRVR